MKGIVSPNNENERAAGIDDVLVEQLNKLCLTSHKWILDMINKCFIENKVQ